MAIDEMRAYWRRKYHERRERLGLVDRKPGRPSKLSEEDEIRLVTICKFYRNRRLCDIAKEFGVSESTVRRYLLKAGHQRRPLIRSSPRTPPAPLGPWWEVGTTAGTTLGTHTANYPI